jgi:hypothetical protein
MTLPLGEGMDQQPNTVSRVSERIKKGELH